MGLEMVPTLRSEIHNLLEHLATTISPWGDILANQLKSNDYVLSMTDSTTTEGW
jgi:hypothetical protein